MTVIVAARTTPALRGLLSRWMLQVHAGVFVGRLSRQVRERVWSTVLGLKRLGRVALIVRDRSEQGFSVIFVGDDRRATVDFDGLTLIKTFAPLRRRGTAGNSPGEGCGGEALVGAPDEAATR